MCIIFFVGTHLFKCLLDLFRNSLLSQWLPHHLTMDSIEVEILLADEIWLKHWDCTLMFDIAGLEGHQDIIQYVKPNALATYLELMMECAPNGYPKQCMMMFPDVY
jgi:hypothetical protein